MTRVWTGAAALFAPLLLVPGCGGPRHAQPQSPSAHAATASIRLRDVAKQAGIDFRLGHKSVVGLNILDTIGHGCAFLDYDGDGKLDILLIADDHCVLYRNRGDGTFEDVTDRAFPGAPRRPRLLGCAAADYDGDGRPDIFVTGYGRTILYHNEGNGTFRDVTAGSGLEARGPYDWTSSAAWADVDGDGGLDLYVCRYVRFDPSTPQLCPYPGLDGTMVDMACGPNSYRPEKGSLYRNLGGGRFADITAQAGMATAHGDALGCMFCDFQNSGRQSLYVANDHEPGDLFVNQGGGRFVNRGIEAGVAFNAAGAVPSGMGVDWGDYDNDGRFDLLAADFSLEPKSLYHNDGDTRFSQASYSSGLGAATINDLSFGASFVDLENSGWLDVVLTNGHVLGEIPRVDRDQTYAQRTTVLRNLPPGHFDDVTAQAGPDVSRKIVGRGLAVGDFDGDGREDLLIVDDEGSPLLLHNESPGGSHWIGLRCVDAHGGPAVGARVTVTAGGRRQIGEVRASGSYLSSNAPDVHFGLGNQPAVESVEVRWPGGTITRVGELRADEVYRVSDRGLDAGRE